MSDTKELYKGKNFKRVTVGGVEYVLQKIPMDEYLDIVDRTTDGLKTKRSLWAKEMLDNVVVEPRVTMDDFADDIASGLELVTECEVFLTEKTSDQKK